MAFKVGDKAKVVDKESFLYNKTVELTKIDNEVYIFYCEPKKLNFVVHKDLIQKTIKWKSSPDKAKINESKDGTLYGCPECEKVCNAAEKNICQRNKMAKVAAMFGKKLGEEFKVKRTIGDFYEVTVAITSNGLFLRGKNAIVVNRMGVLEDLLTGEAVIAND